MKNKGHADIVEGRKIGVAIATTIRNKTSAGHADFIHINNYVNLLDLLSYPI